MFQSLQAGRVDGVMLDRFKAYHYLDQLKDDRLRVAVQIDSPQEYSVALVNRSVPQLTAKNGCLEKYLIGSHGHLRNRLLKRYVRPVKVESSFRIVYFIMFFLLTIQTLNFNTCEDTTFVLMAGSEVTTVFIDRPL